MIHDRTFSHIFVSFAKLLELRSEGFTLHAKCRWIDEKCKELFCMQGMFMSYVTSFEKKFENSRIFFLKKFQKFEKVFVA